MNAVRIGLVHVVTKKPESVRRYSILMTAHSEQNQIPVKLVLQLTVRLLTEDVVKNATLIPTVRTKIQGSKRTVVLQNKQIVTGSGIPTRIVRVVAVILAPTPEDREDVVRHSDSYATIMFYRLTVPGLGQRGKGVLTPPPQTLFRDKTSVLLSPNHPAETAIVHVGVIE